MVNAVLKFRAFYSTPFWSKAYFSVQLLLKLASEMANSVDTDQIAPSGAV